MNHTGKKAGKKGAPYDFGVDFKILSAGEKQGLLKIARHLERVQAENLSMFAQAPVPLKEGAGKQGLA